MDVDNLDARYAQILERCEPYLLSHRANLQALDLTPLGLPFSRARIYEPTARESLALIDDLHTLDALSFGPQQMRMPRWVLFDCGLFPGLVFGLGCKARDLPTILRHAYNIKPSSPDRFLPLSMWVAIPCAEPRAWFGHNLASANVTLGDERIEGLATLTKLLGVAITSAQRQYGATQWSSPSLRIHLRLGPLEIVSAWTPAHTHAASLSYRLDVDRTLLRAALESGGSPARQMSSHSLLSDDDLGLQRMQEGLERGQRWMLVGVQDEGDGRQRLSFAALEG